MSPRRRVQRQIATPTGGVCPASGWTDDGAPTAASTSFSASGLTDGSCYRWLFGATDNVGNATVPTTLIGGPALVDSSGPTAPAIAIDNLANAYDSGGTIFYNPTTGGAFRVTATSTASASGIAGYTFNDSVLLSHGFTRGGVGNQAVLTFNPFATDATGTVTATSNSGVNSPATSFSLVADGTGPLAPTIGCSVACSSNATVSVTLSANGDGSGSGVQEIRYTTDGSDADEVEHLLHGRVQRLEHGDGQGGRDRQPEQRRLGLDADDHDRQHAAERNDRRRHRQHAEHPLRQGACERDPGDERVRRHLHDRRSTDRRPGHERVDQRRDRDPDAAEPGREPAELLGHLYAAGLEPAPGLVRQLRRDLHEEHHRRHDGTDRTLRLGLRHDGDPPVRRAARPRPPSRRPERLRRDDEPRLGRERGHRRRRSPARS